MKHTQQKHQVQKHIGALAGQRAQNTAYTAIQTARLTNNLRVINSYKRYKSVKKLFLVDRSNFRNEA